MSTSPSAPHGGFRASGDTGEPLKVVAVTMPPWPLDGDDGHPRFPRNGAAHPTRGPRVFGQLGGDPAGHVPAQVMDQLAVRIGQALRLDP
jgi:hypothetical protein